MDGEKEIEQLWIAMRESAPSIDSISSELSTYSTSKRVSGVKRGKKGREMRKEWNMMSRTSHQKEQEDSLVCYLSVLSHPSTTEKEER